MEQYYSDEAPYESDANVSRDHRYTVRPIQPSISGYRSVKALTISKLIHLAKRLLAENTRWAHNEALKVGLILLRSIPPKGYLAEDLFLLFVRLLQRERQTRQGEAGAGNSHREKLFLKFLSIAGATTPFLRPMILTHAARMIASNGRVLEMKYQIQRNCTEWNLEKHHAAKFYKWIVKHADAVCNRGAERSSDYRIELEHILTTCAERRALPNASIFRLYIEAYRAQPHKIEQVLDAFIALYPRVGFLRRYRVEYCSPTNQKEDIDAYVRGACYSRASLEFAMERKKELTLRELMLMLFEIAISARNNPKNWERLLYHLLTEAPFDDVSSVIHDLFQNELCRVKSVFTPNGTLAMHMKAGTIVYYLAVAKIVLHDEPEMFTDLCAVVRRATGVTLEWKNMQANNPVWRHFKELRKRTEYKPAE